MDTSYQVDTSYGISQTTGLLGFLAGLGIFLWIISIAIGILMIVSMWKIFTKVGKPGWAAIIPIYNIYIMCEIAGKEWWYILLLCVPIANIYAIYVIYNGISKKFGKTTGFTIGMMFLPVIFFPILAFEKDNVVETETTPVQNDLNSGSSFGETPSNGTNLNDNINNEALTTSRPIISNEYVAPSFEPVGSTEPLNNMSSNAVVEQPIMDNHNVAPVAQNVEQSVDTPTIPIQEEIAPISVEQPIVNSAPMADQPIINNNVTSVAQSVEQSVVAPTIPIQEEAAPISVEQPTINSTPVAEQVVTEPISENTQNNVQPVVDIKPEVHTSLWSNNNTNNNQM